MNSFSNNSFFLPTLVQFTSIKYLIYFPQVQVASYNP